ncbi:hypothetical protein HMPREF0548_0975 [Lactobacillus ultunensis DSM 16047]|uniref:Uncharacterized protein n=1 Tax=Lactobacillus ultunensis DSM 16047 TaxID=525365 RepID=C2EMS9_9LACO|nr:hypothetical protein HMPREF0548_0975 [Lactobacillus ultunensis DSM 16047]
MKSMGLMIAVLAFFKMKIPHLKSSYAIIYMFMKMAKKILFLMKLL